MTWEPGHRRGPRVPKGHLSLCPRPMTASLFQISNSQCPIPLSPPKTTKRATVTTRRDRMSLVVGWGQRGTPNVPSWALRPAWVAWPGTFLRRGGGGGWVGGVVKLISLTLSLTWPRASLCPPTSLPSPLPRGGGDQVGHRAEALGPKRLAFQHLHLQLSLTVGDPKLPESLPHSGYNLPPLPVALFPYGSWCFIPFCQPQWVSLGNPQ